MLARPATVRVIKTRIINNKLQTVIFTFKTLISFWKLTSSQCVKRSSQLIYS